MNRSFVTLDAAMTVDAARLELIDSRIAVVLVRRTAAGTTNWHVYSAEAVRRLDGDADARLGTLLAGGEATTALDVAELAGVETVSEGTVVLDRGQPIGVLDPGEAVPPAFAHPPDELVHDGRIRRSAAGGAAATVPFSADASIDGPDTVVLGQRFSLAVSLAAPAPLEGEGRIKVDLDAGVTEFDLDVVLFADGFEGPPDMRGQLHVDATDLRDCRLDVELTPTAFPPAAAHAIEAGLAGHWPATITLFFSHRTVPAGMLVHHLDVFPADHEPSADPAEPEATAEARAPAEQAAGEPSEPTPKPGTAPALAFPDLPSPDLMIVIRDDDPGGSRPGRYTVRLESPHGTVPAGPFTLALDRSAETFAANFAHTITKADKGRFAVDAVHGMGVEINELLPSTFWRHVNDTLAAGRAASGEAPTVLLMTSDPYIPWELAELGERPGDENAPSFLAAQARVGRWILGPPDDPQLAPTIDHRVSAMEAIVGEYPDGGTMDPLDEAEAEGAFLAAEYGAAYRSASEEEIANLFARLVDRSPQLMHFACHGKSDSGGNALVANDGREIPDYAFRKTEAGEIDRPFVFLNACRVGRPSEALNRYGGFAATFIRSGCSGFIGPLWEVDDVVAREVATRFYDGIVDGIGPAELLRRERAKFVQPADKGEVDPPTTLTAYVYYGHPATTISGIRRRQMD